MAEYEIQLLIKECCEPIWEKVRENCKDNIWCNENAWNQGVDIKTVAGFLKEFGV